MSEDKTEEILNDEVAEDQEIDAPESDSEEASRPSIKLTIIDKRLLNISIIR